MLRGSPFNARYGRSSLQSTGQGEQLGSKLGGLARETWRARTKTAINAFSTLLAFKALRCHLLAREWTANGPQVGIEIKAGQSSGEVLEMQNGFW
jgi:hypothetical protein